MLAVCLKCILLWLTWVNSWDAAHPKGGKTIRYEGNWKKLTEVFHDDKDGFFLVFEYTKSRYSEGDNEVFLNFHWPQGRVSNSDLQPERCGLSKRRSLMWALWREDKWNNGADSLKPSPTWTLNRLAPTLGLFWKVKHVCSWKLLGLLFTSLNYCK